MEPPQSEYQESCSITFEWTLRGLKNLFDSTKGDSKSRVTKSARFGGDRWQIMFYANAGTAKDNVEGGGHISLYLSCEPTAEEREAALASSGRWVREGVYKFSFELHNIGKSFRYNQKEAHNHSFSYKTANWGWAQFAKRDTVFYHSTPVKAQDAFVITCNITSSPTPPPLPPIYPLQSVPKELLYTFGELLDDPLYSDVKFVLPRRDSKVTDSSRVIWASKRIIQRADYFHDMFNSSFAEGSSGGIFFSPKPSTQQLDMDADEDVIIMEFEDSDVEDGDRLDFDTSQMATSNEASSATETETMEEDEKLDHHSFQSTPAPPSPRTDGREFVQVHHDPADQQAGEKLTVVVKDVAYITYRAMLYYLYTNNIVFAPLSSSFITPRIHDLVTPSASTPSTPSEAQGQSLSSKRVVPQDSSTTRMEWIKDWMKMNPGRPAPCSAKAAYRLADRLDLRDLKERAAQHIFKSLTVDNIAYEIFSPFAAAFDEIRKFEVNFFLTHWQDIRDSDSMKAVWQQIRNGRHPGFEEVWPLIAQCLEFKPQMSRGTTSVRGGDTSQRS